jgi:pimeloyl-ACP methyl ester carboxylesterase
MGSPLRGAALILPGSGNTGPDGDISSPFLGQSHNGEPANLSLQLAELLAEEGWTSIRYAKRGHEDAQELPRQCLPYLLWDAQEAWNELERKAPGLPTALVGFSEGALLGQIMAAAGTIQEPAGLFLLSPPARPIDHVMAYQFIEWPLSIVERSGRTAFPFLNAPPRGISEQETVRQYVDFYAQMLKMLKAPPFEQWYKGLSETPSFADLIRKSRTKTFVYQGMEDAQFHWTWAAAELGILDRADDLRLFPGLGHCLCPMAGPWRESKTAGPMVPEAIEAIRRDLRSLSR